MARTVEEYKEHMAEFGLSIIRMEGWENLIDNLVDYDGIEYPDEAEAGTVHYEIAEKAASDKYEAEAIKVIHAIKLYLEDVMQELTGDVWELEAVAS